MIVKTTLEVDLQKPSPRSVLYAVQNDGQTRSIELSILNGGTPWEPPQDTTVAISFKKPDGTSGLYDTLPDGTTKAGFVSGSKVTAILTPQVLTCAGRVDVSIVLYARNLTRLGIFPIPLFVSEDPSAGQKISNDYYNFSTLKELNDAIDDLANFGIKEATGTSLVLKGTGEDSFADLRVMGRSGLSKTPSPDSFASISLVGANGEIGVSVGASAADENAQSVSVAVGVGMRGIPVFNGGNFVDSEGQRWLRDELDLVRGVLVRRVGRYVTSNTTTWRTVANYVGAKNIHLFFTLNDVSTTVRGTLCNGLGTAQKYYGHTNEMEINVQTNYLGQHTMFVDVDVTRWSTIDAWQTWVAEHPLTFLYPLDTPVEIPLTPAEVEACRALHTVSPTTYVSNTSAVTMICTYYEDKHAMSTDHALKVFAPSGYGLGELGAPLDATSEVTYTDSSILDTLGVNSFWAYRNTTAPLISSDTSGITSYVKGLSLGFNTNCAIHIGSCNSSKKQPILILREKYTTWGEWEWVNPPMKVGVEYRTIERWDGKAVWTVLVNLGTFASNGLSVTTEYVATDIIRYSGNCKFFAIPSILETMDNEFTIFAAVYLQNNKLRAVVKGGSQFVGRAVYMQFWYTKD